MTLAMIHRALEDAERQIRSLKDCSRETVDLDDYESIVSRLRSSLGGCGSIADLAIAVLEQKGEPMSLREIEIALRELGVDSTSRRGLRPMIVSAVTRRKDKICRVEHGVYAAKSCQREGEVVPA